MQKCLKCGATLPAVGECTSCQGEGLIEDAVPSLLDMELSHDRRREPPTRPVMAPPQQQPKVRPTTPAVPSFADLEKSRPTHQTPRPPAARTGAPPPLPGTPRPPSRPAAAAPPQVASLLAGHEEAAARAAPRAAAPPPARTPRPPEAYAPPPVNRTPRPPPQAAEPVRASRPATPRPPRSLADVPPAPTMPLPRGATLPPEETPPPRRASTGSVTQLEDEPMGDFHKHRAQPAPLWRRALALAVDAAAIGALVSLYLVIALAVTGLKPPTSHLSGLDAVMGRLHAWQPVVLPGVVLTALICLVYSAVFAVVWNGRTPGRRLLGLQLVDGSGLAPTPARASVRALLSAVSFAVFLGGFWLALFDRRGQTLHDKLTSTFIVLPS